MERNIMMRRLGGRISGIILIIISLYLYLTNPLKVQCNLILMILVWSIERAVCFTAERIDAEISL